MKKGICVFIYFIFSTFLLSQSKVKLSELNKSFHFSPHYFVNEQNLKFNQIKNQNFSLEQITKPKVGTEYWSQFYITPTHTLNYKYLQLNLSYSDLTTIYIPQKNGSYVLKDVGVSARKPVTRQENLKTTLIKTDSIDFNAAFYTKNIPLSIFGLASLNAKQDDFSVKLNNELPSEFNEAIVKENIEIKNKEFLLVIHLGMILLSMIYILTHYYFSRKSYFLFYALYLFFLLFNYGFRTFYFYNIYSLIHPYLYLFLNQNGQMLAHLSYMFFFYYFIDLKKHYPKVEPFYRWLIISFVGFILVYNAIIIYDPFTSYHQNLMAIGVYTFVGLSFIIVVIIMFVKRLLHTTIIFIGSLLLLLGYFIAVITKSYFVLVPIVVLETILFLGVITYLDLLNFKRSLELDKIAKINSFKSNFFTNITHDLRTPLTLIISPLNKVVNNKEVTGTDQNNLSLALNNANRMLALVNQLLNISKLENDYIKLKVSKRNHYLYLSSIIESFKYLADQKSIDFKYNISKNKEKIWFDALVLEEVIANLMSNAIKYTPTNGTVIFNAVVENSHLIISVFNTGEGISKEVQDKIFDRFFQEDENSTGIGLGLAIIKDLVKLHKGTISVISEYNEHATFTINIPISEEHYTEDEKYHKELEKTSALSLDATLQNVAHNNSKIPESYSEELPLLLFVDDNKDLRQFVSLNFSDQFKIITAENGKIGIEKAIESIPDIIVSDLMMPEADGITLCNQLKENEITSHIPILLLTAKVGQYNELIGIKSGANDYISKPFNEDLLKTKLQNLINTKEKLREHYQKETSFIPKTLATTALENTFLERLTNVLNESLTDSEFGTAQFSNQIGMSRMQLHRKIKALTGLTTSEFIKNERLKLSVNLMQETETNIAEVGYAVGFNSASYFSKSFKERFGCTPSEYFQKN